MGRGSVSLKVRNHLVEDLGGPTAGYELACWPGPLVPVPDPRHRHVCLQWPCAQYEQVRLRPRISTSTGHLSISQQVPLLVASLPLQ